MLGGLSLDLLLRLLLRHGFWVLLCVVIGPALASLWANRQVRWYQADATIVFDWSQPATLGRRVDVFDPYTDYFNKQEVMETEFHILTSQRVLRQVAADAGLDLDRAFLQANFPGVQAGQLKTEQLADLLRGRIKVNGVKGTSLAEIHYEDTDPVRAQRIVSTIVETYIRVSNEDTVGTTRVALEWLQEQVQKLQEELKNSETDLHKFKQDRNLLSVSLNDQNNLLRSEIESIQTAVTQANIKRAQLVSRANALAKVTRTNPDELPASELMMDATLSQLRSDFIKARSELAQLTAAGKLENHPDVQQAQVILSSSLNSFIHQVRNIQGAALREAAVVTSEAASLQALLDNARKRALELNMEEIKYNQLHRATATNEKLYTNMLERMKEVDLSRMISTKNIKALDPPRVPTSPIRPVIGNILAIGAGFGFFVGLLIAVLRELADRTIRTPTDLEQKLGLPCLGLLPAFEGGPTPPQASKRRNRANLDIADKPELLVAREPTSLIAEAARSIRSNITFMSPDRPPRLLLVTSASASEGKTTVATTLATTFAQANARTLIVDLDLRRPRVHKVFDLGLEHGVTSLLLGEETLDEAIQPTSVQNLSVLPAGRIPPNPAELLMSERLADLLGQLRERFDRVIIDSPPTNPVTDSVILSTKVDGAIFVVRSYSTTIDQMRHSLRAIRSVKGKLLGVILNVVDLKRLEYKYSYNYRYYSGYGEYSEATPKALPMLGFLLPALFFAIIFGLAHRNKEPKDVLNILLAGYMLRMVLQSFLRDLPVFSYGSGGDYLHYEMMGEYFARIWSHRGVEFFTADDFGEVGSAALPINIFALIIYLNGGLSRAGCTSVVAFCAVMSCYIIYRIAFDLGADRDKATKTMGVLMFLPGYLYYSSDMYKDPLVLFFVLLAFTSSIRLVSRFSVLQLFASILSLLGLWYVRRYLVYLTVAPLIVGVIGLGKGSVARQIVLGSGVVLLTAIFLRSSAGQNVLTSVDTTFSHATDAGVRGWNQRGGSGVSFDDGGQALGAIHLKILYTLFSPFPWQSGSFAMQMGKLDTSVWYFFFARALRSGQRLWREDRPSLLMFLVFLIPLTVAYATTMANIGLILRQRFPIVFVGIALGILSWPAPRSQGRLPWGRAS